MDTIRIFLASSEELATERNAFGQMLYEKSKQWKDDRNTFLELKNWEEAVAAISPTRSQDEYNKDIRAADIFVMLYWTKVGKYTNEEFDVALAQFKQTGRPLIYTYRKAMPGSQLPEPSVGEFETKLKDLNHFKIDYETTGDLKYHFSMQLDKLYQLTKPGPASTSLIPNEKKDQLIDMLDQLKTVDAFYELKKIFGDKELRLNILMKQFVYRSDNFNLLDFIERTKLFVMTS